MSSLLIYGLVASLLCLSGVIYAVLNVHRLIDLSRVHPRTNPEKSVDDDGLLTRLTPDQRASVVREKERLAHSSIKEARLRTDLPPLPSTGERDIGDDDIVASVDREWVEEVRAGRDWREETSAEARAARPPRTLI